MTPTTTWRPSDPGCGVRWLSGPEVPHGLAPVDPVLLAGRVRASYETDLGDGRSFLPSRVPLDKLPAEFSSHLAACAELPQRYPRQGGGVRRWLDRQFATDEPAVRRAVLGADEAERDRLMTVFTVLGHTYRWDCLPPVADRFGEHVIALPPGIAGPWELLAAACGHPRVGTTWSLHLCNWAMKDRPGGAAYRPDELTGDNIRVRHNWLPPPYDADLDRFSISFVLLEARGASVLEHLVRTIDAAAHERPEEAMASLDDLHTAIAAMTLAFSLSVRKRTVDPSIWLHLIQPTFAWSASAGCPRRVEGGPSGMQVGTIQALDAALGVPGGSALADMARKGRRYLPVRHRRFLEALDAAGPVIRSFVLRAGSSELTERFNRCVGDLGRFRTTHRARGVLYLNGRPDGGGPRASTGLAIAVDDDPTATFERLMTERVAETSAALIM